MIKSNPYLSEVITTERLLIRRGYPEDAPDFYRLWKDPLVMTNVGYPKGLPITEEEIRDRLRFQVSDSLIEPNLIIERREDGAVLGEAHMRYDAEMKIVQPDVKLFPEFWGHGYGPEAYCGMADYVFRMTDCEVIEGSPNKANAGSIRMQEKIGAVPVTEGVYTFPEHMRDYTCDVPYIIYQITREAWKKRQG